jgi:signal peptidase I
VIDEQATAAVAERSPRRRRPFWRELPILLGVAVVVALLVRIFVMQTFFIPSQSMEHTLNINDRVLVNKLVYDFRAPERGEVIVFTSPMSWRSSPDEKDFIKRVIGVGGDHVACCTNSKVTVNGVPLNEPYLKPGVAPSDQTFDVTVPKGHLWVMGDNRSNSSDSRAHINDPDHGFIPTNKVIGRAFIKVWPFSHFGVLHVPKTFNQTSLPPYALGAVGAIPVVALRRRRRARRAGKARPAAVVP